MPANDANVDQVAAVTELITGGSPEPAATPGSGDASPNADPGAPDTESGDQPGTDDLTPTVLAERLGMTPKALFKDLKIPVDGGDPLSLEEFKSAGKQLRDVRDAQADLAEKRVAFENETMTQRQTLQGMLAKIPGELLTDDLVAGVQVEHQAYVEGERKALFGIRPDLQDAAKYSQVRQMLIEHLAPYGFRDVEVDGIIDHRLAKYVIDNAERQIRVKELEKSAEKGGQPLSGHKPKPAAASKRATKKTSRRNADKPRTLRDKAAEVAALLGDVG